MKEFTFIVLCYNQEKIIIEHLESIKSIVVNYSKDIKIDIVVADDCSTDGTALVCEEWLAENRSFFRNIIVIKRKKNIGIVHNLLEAIQKTRTEHFKFLAGDDTYEVFDIFLLYEKLNDSILITHVNFIGENNYKKQKEMEIRFKVIQGIARKKKMNKFIKIENYIAAPAVFIPGKLLRSQELFRYLNKYRNIEDYPMWMFFLVNKRIKTKVEDRRLINYRLGSGVTNASNNSKRSIFLEELTRVYKDLGSKNHYKLKYINPYKYYLKLLRLKAIFQLKKENKTNNNP